MEDLGFSKKKAIDHLTELENFGLVEKRRRGLGLPSILYVKSFINADKTTDDGSRGVETGTSENDDDKEENRGTQNGTSRSVGMGTSRGVKIDTSRGAENALQEVPGGEPLKNNTKDNKTNGSDIGPNLIIFDKSSDKMDAILESAETYQEIIRANISYDALISDHPNDIEAIDGIVRLILETVISTKEYILISGDKRPAALVKEQMLRLGHKRAYGRTWGQRQHDKE